MPDIDTVEIDYLALVAEVRGWLLEPGVRLAPIARGAGLGVNTLYKVHNPDWRPSWDVLRKLRAYRQREAGRAQAEPSSSRHEAA